MEHFYLETWNWPPTVSRWVAPHSLPCTQQGSSVPHLDDWRASFPQQPVCCSAAPLGLDPDRCFTIKI